MKVILIIIGFAYIAALFSYYSPSILSTEIPALESTKGNSLYKCLVFNALVYALENILL